MPCQQVVSLEYEGVEETTAATEIGTVTLPNPLSVYQSISGMRLRAAMSWSSAGLKLDPEACACHLQRGEMALCTDLG